MSASSGPVEQGRNRIEPPGGFVTRYKTNRPLWLAWVLLVLILSALPTASSQAQTAALEIVSLSKIYSIDDVMLIVDNVDALPEPRLTVTMFYLPDGSEARFLDHTDAVISPEQFSEGERVFVRIKNILSGAIGFEGDLVVLKKIDP